MATCRQSAFSHGDPVTDRTRLSIFSPRPDSRFAESGVDRSLYCADLDVILDDYRALAGFLVRAVGSPCET